MPNHIKNNIKVSGDEAVIRSMLEDIAMPEDQKSPGNKGQYLITFTKIIPLPKGTNLNIDCYGPVMHMDPHGAVTDYYGIESWISYEKQGLVDKKGVIDEAKYDLFFSRFKDLANSKPKYLSAKFIEWLGEITRLCSNDSKHWDTIKDAIKNKMICGSASWYKWNVNAWGTKWDAYDQENKGDILNFETAWSHPKPIINKLSEMYPSLKFHVQYADEDYGHNFGEYTICDGIESDLTHTISNPEKFAVELHSNYESYEEYKEMIERDK